MPSDARTNNPSDSATQRDLFLISALFLFMELAFIRWFPAQVLFLTFFTNTVLLASFLGLSLGCLVAARKRNYLSWTPIVMIVSLGAGIAMEGIRLALQDILEVGKNRTDPQTVYFGTEIRVNDVAKFAIPIEWVIAGFFLLIAITMLGVGQALGRRLSAVSEPVKAYSINVAGSLVGVLLFQLFSIYLSPLWWFALIALGLAYFLWTDSVQPVRWAAVLALLTPIVLLLPQLLTVGVIRERFPEEHWSPYYRINYSKDSRTIVVNLIGHQTMVSRKDAFPAYAIPYLLNRDSGQPKFKDIMIIGAGSGNDVSRALQWAAPDAHIDAVEIDPVIQSLGKRDHPDRPYDDPRVTVHLNDGRNFLKSTDRKYDLVIFALVDSLVLHSSLSDIRLESYLFTQESLADVRRVLRPDGLFAMYNYFRQGWIVSRLAKEVQNDFGAPPLVITMPKRDRVEPDQKAEGFTLLMTGPRSQAIRDKFAAAPQYTIAGGVAPTLDTPDGFTYNAKPAEGKPANLELAPAAITIPENLRVAEDEWPFLYLRNPAIPDLSLRGIIVLGLVSLVLLWIFSRGSLGINSAINPAIDPAINAGMNAAKLAIPQAGLYTAMFLMGAGFMLLETKAVVHMALIFGGTWIVNTVVFSVILVMILLSNLLVVKLRPVSVLPYFIALTAALLLNVFVPLSSFLGYSILMQGILAGLLVLSPVLCSGVIFAVLFRGASHPERALAFNTAGAIAGGLAESVSLLIGFKYLVVVAIVIYLGSWAAAASSKRNTTA
jgi:SAM-dependent methyltransferase